MVELCKSALLVVILSCKVQPLSFVLFCILLFTLCYFGAAFWLGEAA